MPWCPKCRSEYKEGVQRCLECGAALVSELPAEGREPRVPSRWNRFWQRTEQEPEWEAPEAESGTQTAIAAQMQTGLWLVPHAAWRASRMSRVWAILAALAAFDAVGETVRNRTSTPSAAPASLRDLWDFSMIDLQVQWESASRLGQNLAQGISGPFQHALNTLTAPAWPLFRWVWSRPGAMPAPYSTARWAALSWWSLIAAVVAAVAYTVLYGMIAARLRRDCRDLPAEPLGIWRSFHSILGWELILWLLAIPTLAVASDWFYSVLGLVLVPFALTRFAIVSMRTGTFAGVAAGLSILVRRWPLLLVVFAAYRIARAAASVLGDFCRSIATQYFIPGIDPSGLQALPDTISRNPVITTSASFLLLFVKAGLLIGVSLFLATALMLVVVCTSTPKPSGHDSSEVPT